MRAGDITMPEISTPRPGAPRARRRPWELRFGSIRGIPIRIHITLLLFFMWIAVTYWIAGLGPRGTVTGVLLLALVFVTIVLHELTHALVARRFGVRTRDILLLPIGGIASLERIPDRPRQELAIALAGPAFNLVVAALVWAGLALAGSDLSLATASTGEAFALQFMWINVLLAAFNLLPAFPLDGGRALRALLTRMMRRERATAIAAGIGQGVAVLLGLVGLTYNPWLALIAVFLWFAARSELAMVRLRAALAGVPASAAMLGRIDSVRADEPLATAAGLLMHHGGSAIPVVQDGAPIAALTREDIAAGLAAAGPEAPVTAAPAHQVVTIAPSEPLDQVLERLESDVIAVVVDQDVPVGVLTAEQLASFVALQLSAPSSPARSRPGAPRDRPA
jgi:Zn-dependent protease/CBS domain-containing protein